MSRQKRPTRRVEPRSEKVPRSAPLPNVLQQPPSWSFGAMDIGGPWCFYREKCVDLRKVVDGLRPFETMTWGEIEGASHHFVSCDAITPEALKRLRKIRQDDVDALFSLRLSGKNRVWGIRDGAVLRLLWWDPEHAVCPAKKKHT